MWNQQIKFLLHDSFDCFIVYRHNGKCITTSVTHLFQQLILFQRHKWWFCCHFTTNNSLTHKSKLKIIFVLKWNENIQLEFLHLQFLKNCICIITTLMKKKQTANTFVSYGVKFFVTFILKKRNFCASIWCAKNQYFDDKNWYRYKLFYSLHKYIWLQVKR